MKRILVGIFLFYFNSYGQITFERRDSIDGFAIAAPIASSIIETPDHGYLISGTIAQGLINTFYLEKIDSVGHHLWGYYFTIPGEDSYIHSAALTSDSGFILCGKSGGDKMGIIKTDSYGNPEWYKVISNQQMFFSDAGSALQTKDEGYIVAGAMINFNTFSLDASIMKLDGFGNFTWSKSYGVVPGLERFNDIEIMADSGFIAVGGNEQILIVRTDSVGNTLWTKHFQNGLTHMDAKSITGTYDSCFIVSAYSSGAPVYGSLLLKINAAGDTLWTKNFGYMETLIIKSVEETNDHGLILSATKDFTNDGLVIKIDSLGNLQWVREIPPLYGCTFAIQTGDNGFAYVGSYFRVIKTDSSGNSPCTSISGSVNISNIGLDQLFDTISVQNNILPNPVTGYYLTLNLDEVMICNSLNVTNLKRDEFLVMITPNPAENYIKVNSQSELFRIEIYNALGLLVQNSALSNLKDFEIDISHLSPSIYFIKLFSKEGVATLKFIKN